MVVFVDLESDDDDPCQSALGDRQQQWTATLTCHAAAAATSSANAPLAVFSSDTAQADNDCDSKRLSGSAAFSAALTCYPIALTLASHLDLNDLHALSLTCRSIRDSLVPFASRLVAGSLRCSFDGLPLLADLLHAEFDNPGDSDDDLPPSSSLTTGLSVARLMPMAVTTKTFPCARDLVASCQKCGLVVCRNCAAKAPSDRYLAERHRRLCRKCLDAPLIAHLQPLRGTDEHLQGPDTPPASIAGSVGAMLSSSSPPSSSPSSSAGSSILLDDVDSGYCNLNTFTSKVFLRGPCQCASRGSYLCAPCGHSLRTNDTMYLRAWTWRSRYSTHIGGGIGTGLGLGDQGQKCGRGEYCLETGPESVSWVELDCGSGCGDENEAWALSRSATPTTPTPTLTPLGAERSSPSGQNKRPGYFQQEIEGIGGVVKTKIRKKVKVGATVYEFEDERRSGKYLERESSGQERSWCGWCGRVCLGERDVQDEDGL